MTVIDTLEGMRVFLRADRSARLPISAVYPHRRDLTAKLQRFVDCLPSRMTHYGLA